MGCNDLQGYYFAKPMLADELIAQQTIQSIVERLIKL